MRSIILLCLIFAASLRLEAQPYKNPELPVQERVNDLLSRMTPEEKFWQMFMIPGDLGPDKDKFKTGIFGLQVSTVGRSGNAAARCGTS